MDPEIAERIGGAEIQLSKVAKTYGEFTAVHELSLKVNRGEFFTILGPSGSGKTTTLMMIAGFVQPTRGEISTDGRIVTRLPPQARQIGMVFQNYALFPHLTVFENVAFPLRVRRVASSVIAQKVTAILEVVRLTGFENRLPQQLSGGQQQRVALARTLVFGPSLVLLDEPLGALDKKLRSHMQSEIRQIQRRLALTVIYITHDQEEALTMSDRVAVMNHGRVEQIGSPAELYERPANAFVADFLGESNFIPAVVIGSEAGCYLVEAQGGLRFRGISDFPLRDGQKVTAAVRPEKFLLLAAPADGANHCGGERLETVYIGDATRYHLRLDGGAEIVVKAQNQPGFTVSDATRTLAVTWHATDTRLFADSPG